jgi:hypothetical protein
MAKKPSKTINKRTIVLIVIIAVFLSSIFALQITPRADVASPDCGFDMAIAFDIAHNRTAENVSRGGVYYEQAFPEGLQAAKDGVGTMLDYIAQANSQITDPTKKPKVALGTFPTDTISESLTDQFGVLKQRLSTVGFNGASNVEIGLTQAYAQLEEGRTGLAREKRIILLVSPVLDDKYNLTDISSAQNTSNFIRQDNLTLAGAQLGTAGYMSTIVPVTTTFGRTNYVVGNGAELKTALLAIAKQACGGYTPGSTSIINTIEQPPAGQVSMKTTANKTRIRPGGSVDITFQYTNNTSSLIYNAKITQVLPTELYIPYNAGIVDIPVGDVAPGETKTRTITAFRR